MTTVSIPMTILAAYDAQQVAQAGEHSAGPWRVGVTSSGDTAIYANDEGGIVCLLNPGRNWLRQEMDANARRIVACVNALSGMTLAEIESFGAPGELGRCAQAWVAEDNDHA